jgi:hypothetical protein
MSFETSLKFHCKTLSKITLKNDGELKNFWNVYLCPSFSFLDIEKTKFSLWTTQWYPPFLFQHVSPCAITNISTVIEKVSAFSNFRVNLSFLRFECSKLCRIWTHTFTVDRAIGPRSPHCELSLVKCIYPGI